MLTITAERVHPARLLGGAWHDQVIDVPSSCVAVVMHGSHYELESGWASSDDAIYRFEGTRYSPYFFPHVTYSEGPPHA